MQQENVNARRWAGSWLNFVGGRGKKCIIRRHSRRATSFSSSIRFLVCSSWWPTFSLHPTILALLFLRRVSLSLSRGTLFFPVPSSLPRGMNTVCINEHAPPPASYYPHLASAATGTPALSATLYVQPDQRYFTRRFPFPFSYVSLLWLLRVLRHTRLFYTVAIRRCSLCQDRVHVYTREHHSGEFRI